MVLTGGLGESLELGFIGQTPVKVFPEKAVGISGRLLVPGGQVGLGRYVLRTAQGAAEKDLAAGDPDQLTEMPGALPGRDVLEHVEAHREVEAVVFERKYRSVKVGVCPLTFHVDRRHFRAGQEETEFPLDSADVEDRAGRGGQPGDDRVPFKGIRRHAQLGERSEHCGLRAYFTRP